jgi:oligopeptidase B
MKPPVARVSPETLEKHGHVRVDEYYWMKERDNPDVVGYLNAENAYTDGMMRHTEAFQETLFAEFKTRIKQTDISVPQTRRLLLLHCTEEGRVSILQKKALKRRKK